MKIFEFIQTLTEGARTPHPEDFIFQGSQSAQQAVDGIVAAVSSPDAVTIKWDGFPAIIFGRRSADGKFTMNYKEYIADVGGQVTTPQELLQFFSDRQKNMELANKLAEIFTPLSTIVPASFKGFVMGDLMWSAALQPQQGKFVFKANPHGVTYAVDSKSDLGKQIAGRQIGIAVHTYGSDLEKQSKESPLVGKQPLNGAGGLVASKTVAILTGNLGIKFGVKEPVQLVKAAYQAIKKYGSAADSLLTSLTASSKSSLQTYYNRLITNQPVDDNWLASKLTKPQYAILTAVENQTAVQGIKEIWTKIYQLKLGILEQLEPQVRGIEQFVDGQPKGEGFVINTPSGIIKLVNRGVFSAANFAGRVVNQ